MLRRRLWWQDLEALKAPTARVGEGDFGVRADVAGGSMLQPIATAFNSMADQVVHTLDMPDDSVAPSLDLDGIDRTAVAAVLMNDPEAPR